MHAVRTADPSMTSVSRMSLRRLVETVLEVTIDKEEQTSDWQTRPLTEQQVSCKLKFASSSPPFLSPWRYLTQIKPNTSNTHPLSPHTLQITYAALDAYILTLLWSKVLTMKPALASPPLIATLSGVLLDTAQSYTKRHRSAVEIWQESVLQSTFTALLLLSLAGCLASDPIFTPQKTKRNEIKRSPQGLGRSRARPPRSPRARLCFRAILRLFNGLRRPGAHRFQFLCR